MVWQDEDGNHRLPLNEVAAIKQELIGLMISVPPNVQYQLGDAIGVIADSDFWEKWDTLVDVSANPGITFLALLKRCIGPGLPSDTGHPAHQ